MKKSKCYFGAANGYTGFRSNFGKIFDKSRVDCLFIIKGGPGTGKSTLMRRIHERYRDVYDTTVILCSSDPESLDGVFIRDGVKAVAIVDGTPPHTLEPKYPGAQEVIINLGDAFDTNALMRHKADIFEMSIEKKRHYDRAYNALKIAGQIHEYIRDNLLNYECYNTAEQLFKPYIHLLNQGCFTKDTSDFLVSSFSKNGYACHYPKDSEKRVITIGGDAILGYVLTSKIAEILKKHGLTFTVFPSAFSPELIDLIETDEAVYMLSNDNSCTVDASALMPYTNGYDETKLAYGNFIEEARSSLFRASEYHFMLEDIYSSAIDFSMNEKKREAVEKTIDSILINNVD